MSMDGKGINGTLEYRGTAKQRYTNLVSIFVQKTKQVLAQGKVGNKTNEIPLVASMIKEVGLTGIIFTADALHCQKETIKAVIESGNDYVIGVKANQKTLLNTLKKTPMPTLSAAIQPKRRTEVDWKPGRSGYLMDSLV